MLHSMHEETVQLTDSEYKSHLKGFVGSGERITKNAFLQDGSMAAEDESRVEGKGVPFTKS